MIEELRLAAKPTLQDALGWIGLRVDDIFGVTIGTIADVIPGPGDEQEPRWLLIRGGRFGGHYTLVPLDDASVGTENVWVPFERATVRDAPTVAPAETLTQELDDQLDAHYRDARGLPAPPVLGARTQTQPQHAHRLGRSRQNRSGAVSTARPSSRADEPIQVSDAQVRIKGSGEIDGEPVEIELEGTFTGTIRRRA